MAGVITRGSIAELLWPGINKIFDDTYNAHPEEYAQLFDKATSQKAYEKDLMVVSTGYVPQKPEGSPIQYDTIQQAYPYTYNHLTYALGFIITKEAEEDNLYMDMAKKGTPYLARSYQETRELICHDIYNDGFAGGATYGDGKTFFASDHPLFGGSGTYSNVLATATDLSEAALEDLITQINRCVNNRGLLASLKPVSLHVPTELQFEAERLLKNPDRPATADRDINAIFQTGRFPKGYFVHTYLTDPDAFFIRTNAMDAVRYFDRIAPSFDEDNDFDTTNYRYKVRGRFSAGVSDWRGAFASPGSA